MTDERSFSDYRAAARSVRTSTLGRDVLGVIRPRTLGIFRTRAPIAVQLHLAALDGRLVWRSTDSFAMLRRPADRAAKGAGHRVLRLADSNWSLVVLLAEFAVFLVGVLVLLLLRDTIGRPATFYAAMLLLCALLIMIVVDYLWTLLQTIWRGLVSLRRGAPAPDRVAAETLPYEQWTMVLCHQVDPAGAGELLAGVTNRFTWLAGDDTALICLRNGITTTEMRQKVAAWADGLPLVAEDPEVSVRFTGKPSGTPNRVLETGSFFFLYLAGVLMMILSTASMVAFWERDACAGSDCSGRPSTYPLAVVWLGQRLLWSNPPDLSPTTFYARTTGMMVSVLSLVGILVALAALRQYRNYRESITKPFRDALDEAQRRSTVLLLVATPVERNAVLAVAGRKRADRDFTGHPVDRLGVIGNTTVLLAQTGAGSLGPVSAGSSVPDLIRQQRPDYVISTGICFGLRKGEQRLGDIIVSRQLRSIGPRRVGETDDGTPDIRIRGDFVTAAHRLYDVFSTAEPPAGVRVFLGTLLSWDVLVDSQALRDELVRLDRDALGGEMEGAGIYAAATRAKIDWIVVKAISDWGHGKTGDAQQRAATNAATLVLDVIRSGALATSV